ncbi:hypothetical protein HDU86_000136 [Geranomyces michiganensis]|nr:hypothetical protein HDU86_000136 [Geranomyces michiganensis]
MQFLSAVYMKTLIREIGLINRARKDADPIRIVFRDAVPIEHIPPEDEDERLVHEHISSTELAEAGGGGFLPRVGGG